MTVSVPADELEREVSSRLSRLAKNLKLPGFRPGKVPRKVVEARFGGQVIQEAAGELIQNTYRDALGQQGLNPATTPAIEATKLERGADLEYVASFDVFPEIARLDLKGKQVERPRIEIQDHDVERTIESVRRQRVTWDPVERPAQRDDRVVIDFEGTIDGESFEGGAASDFPAVLGSGGLVEDLDEGLVGARAGDERKVKVSFSDDYPGKKVAGKTAEFTVKIKQVAEPVLPEVDEEFARAFGVEDGDRDKLRAEVRENLQRELDERLRRHLHDQVMNLLLEGNEFDVPQQMVDEEAQRMAAAIMGESAKRRSGAAPHVDTTVLVPEARRRVALGLILRDIIAKHSLVADAGRVRAKIDTMAASYEHPEAFVQWYYADQNRLAQVQSSVVEEQIVDLLVEEADCVDKEMSFEEFMNALGRRQPSAGEE